MAEAESEEAVWLRSKASEMLLSPSSIALPASNEPKSSYFLTQSLAEMANEDPIKIQNQSCVIREEIAKLVGGEKPVYSSLARLPTFSIGLSSTQGEAPPRASACESRVDLKEKNSPRYFQMPELGARVFVGDVDGCDTITCHLTDYSHMTSSYEFISEYAMVRSFYENDRLGGISSRLRELHVESYREDYFNVILSGTELVFASPNPWGVGIMVGNLRGKGSSVSGSSSDYKDRVGDETNRQPLDIVEQLGNIVPSVSSYDGMRYWRSLERPYLWRSTKGSYLKKPKFMKGKLTKFGYSKYNLSKRDVLQLTTFDDFVIVGCKDFRLWLCHEEIIDIVRKNASETANVIATKLVKSMMETNRSSFFNWITIIVILLDHKEILLRERKKEKKENVVQKYKATLLGFLGLKALKGISQSTALKDDQKIIDLKGEEKITTSKEKEQIFPPEIEDKKGMKIEEDYKEKILGESLLQVLQISIISLQGNEVGVKTTKSSNLSSATTQDDSEASSFVVLFKDDDCKNPAANQKVFEIAPQPEALLPVKALKAPPSFKASSMAMLSFNPKPTAPNKPVSLAVTPFSVADLQSATNSFSPEALVGEGSLGRVYRAEFANGQVLAVKKIDRFNAPLVENKVEFLGAVQGLARLQHANVVELVGYCVEHEQRLLVFQFVGRGNLHDLLHYDASVEKKGNLSRLTWNVRMKIALGAAKALEYMHEVCMPPVVHRSFKSANILLDDKLNPHVSDCGLAALSPSGSEREVSAQMLGSLGYSALEYAMSETYTMKSDVYSFGVVMLELLTRRKPLDSSRPRSEQSLVRWVGSQLHDIDALARMVDPALKGKYPTESLSRLVDIVALCVQPEPEFRPPMSEVVQAFVRLMHRAASSKRRSDSEAGLDSIEPSENDHSVAANSIYVAELTTWRFINNP